MRTPALCVTVTAATTAELRQRRDAAIDTAGADLVELRLDSVRDPNVPAALAGRRGPVIVTCRPAWEGGQFQGPESDRRRLLEQALTLDAEYVDVEWRAGFDDLIRKTGGRRIVISMHDFDGLPADLGQRAAAMRATGAEVVKLAVRAQRLTDCLALLELGSTIGRDGRIVLIGMGPHGVATRVLVQRFGSAWTYAGEMSDLGQVTAAQLRDEYRFRSLGEATTIYGLTGASLAHSVSPAMHNAALAAAGLDAVYLPLPAADCDDFVGFARALGIRGASVTIPFKVAMLARVDEVDPIAREIGAINTIRVVAGRWIGGNSDAKGFLLPLDDRRVALRGMRASILGAGGAARAVAIALCSRGAAVRVHARNHARAGEVAASASAGVGPWPPEPGSWDLLVNCTPIGMHPRGDESPLPPGILTKGLVYDLVYNPTITPLLRDAAAAGCQTIGGLEMLVAQAGEQFESWTGQPPALEVMRAAATKRLSEFASDDHHVV